MAIYNYYSFLSLNVIKNDYISNVVLLKYIGGTTYFLDDGRVSVSYDSEKTMETKDYYSRFSTGEFKDVKETLNNILNIKNDVLNLSMKEDFENKTLIIRLIFLHPNLKKSDRFLLKEIVSSTVEKLVKQEDNVKSIDLIRQEYKRAIDEIRLFKKLENESYAKDLDVKVKKKI